jgi:glycosyltransferase involved in cell wall biosynthesis
VRSLLFWLPMDGLLHTISTGYEYRTGSAAVSISLTVEAMASGIPVIASANGGIAAIATRKKWAGGIVKQARIDAVKQFSWQAAAQSLADFYRLKLEEKHEKSGKETDES